MDRDVLYVSTIASCKSISQAAEKLYITQPSLSRYISHLEHDLGLALFSRSSQGISLTDAGRVYIKYAEEILSVYQQMQTELSELRRREQNEKFIIGMVMNGTSLMTDKIKRKYQELHPHHDFEIIDVTCDEIEFKLLSASVDMAIGPKPKNELAFAMKELNKELLIACVPVEYDVAAQAEEREGYPFRWIDVSCLERYPFVMQTDSSSVRIAQDRIFRERGIVVVPVQEYSNSLSALMGAELQKTCCIVHENMLSYIRAPESMNYYVIGDDETTPSSYLIYLQSKTPSQYEMDAVKAIDEVYASLLRDMHSKMRKLGK